MNLTTKIESVACVTISNTEILKNKKLCKDIIPKKPGIYKIINSVDGKYYVGSSKNLFQRMKTHFSQMSKGKHENVKLQRSYLFHGGDNFSFNIIEIFDSISYEELLKVENRYLFV